MKSNNDWKDVFRKTIKNNENTKMLTSHLFLVKYLSEVGSYLTL